MPVNKIHPPSVTLHVYQGLSTDRKPGDESDPQGYRAQDIPVGSTFREIDTGKTFVWNGAWPWLYYAQPLEPQLQELIELNRSLLKLLIDGVIGLDYLSLEAILEPELT